MIIVPSDSGFSRRAPTTAAPIRAWAKPVARAANPIARPAPSAINPIVMTRPPFPACRPSYDRSKRLVGATATDEEILEELHVVETNGLDGGERTQNARLMVCSVNAARIPSAGILTSGTNRLAV